MGNPFRPGTVYYADVPAEHTLQNETRNNPEKGCRPWIVIFCRQHKSTGVVIAAPLYSKGDADVISHVRCVPEHFDEPQGSEQTIRQGGFIKLEQLRAMDKARFQMDRGPLGRMKQQPFAVLRATLMGMFEPRLVPPAAGGPESGDS
jgi:hypothetical protein